VINRADLLKSLQALLPHIERDILAYSEVNTELNDHLKQEYQAALDAERTAEHFVAWREAQITQAAVAWVLTCIFVRFLEDNGLLTEPVLAGPVSNAQGINALQHAKERMQAYFNEHPTHEERHYLLDLFDRLQQYPVIAELLDQRHNPLWQIPVSADGAKRLIDFFQRIDPETGDIEHDFTDAEWDTRFLGDLYQDLSESVRKRYALLQTPEFVESFILDYTLEPAIDSFGLPDLRLIDPTCGSGHFLLTTFERVFERWLKREPGTNTRELAQRALNVVHGTDINPYAIAICRFRLLIAAMKAAGSLKIKDAPAFEFHLACGDSLLHGRRFEWEGQGNQQDMLDEHKHVYEVEDDEKLNEILGQRYHVVVGNPPYITVKDPALNQVYRNKYLTCHRKYSLGVPFTERFFDLAMSPEQGQAGYIGMITTNSFMRREFGKKLIEEYLPKKDLTHIIDSADAYIPGHGTPTVIIFARNQQPKVDKVRVVLGIHGEGVVPENPEEGKVWHSIVSYLNYPGSENDFISVVDQDREFVASHPWSLGGGGASDLKIYVENEKDTLSSRADVIGFGAILGEDDLFEMPLGRVSCSRFPKERKYLVNGDQVRDWSLNLSSSVIFPYDSSIDYSRSKDIDNYLWPYRNLLWNRKTFSKETYKDAGKGFYEYHQIPVGRNKKNISIVFAEVSTHNHFVIDYEHKVYNKTAPVIKLKNFNSVDEYIWILGLLNSSVACFWIKQVFYPKGGDKVGSEGARVSKNLWEERYQIAGTGLKKFPIPLNFNTKVYKLTEELENLSKRLKKIEPEFLLKESDSNISFRLSEAKKEDEQIFNKMIALQEELDWCIYEVYGLSDISLCYDEAVPEVPLGYRAFEIKLARNADNDSSSKIWFERHGSNPTTELPDYWPDNYKDLVKRRLNVIEQNRWIKLVEKPEYKRRWSRNHWDIRLTVAAKEWLLDSLEKVCKSPELITCAQLADRLRHDETLKLVAEIYSGTDLMDIQALVSELVERDNVPQMAAARLKPTAMPKYRAWQETWDKQRLEDAIDARHGVDQPLSKADAKDADKQKAYNLAKVRAEAEKQQQVGDIPVPPQYKQLDFRKASYWSLRGKLDVPKERFFSLPGCEKAGDSTLVIGWAGLNHLQRAMAIAAWYLDRKDSEGWEAEQLMPMLVALDELIPWLKQWHNEVDPEYGERMGDYYEGFLLEELRTLDIPRATLLSWMPPTATRKRGGGRKKKAATEA